MRRDTKTCVLGIKVKIKLDWDPKWEQGPKTPFPDHVTINTPKEEEECNRPPTVLANNIEQKLAQSSESKVCGSTYNRTMVTDIVGGTIRWRRYLDDLISSLCLDKDISSMKPLLLQLLDSSCSRKRACIRE